MKNPLSIEQIEEIETYLDELVEMLTLVVEGASIGFLPPVTKEAAVEYWKSVEESGISLFIARIQDRVVGSVQLHECSSQNGRHRAEIAKMMVHPDFRQQGIARKLMIAAEEKAIQDGKTLLVLDTREGTPANSLYNSLGYVEVGRIPNYARSADGTLHTTVIYYKQIGRVT
ncbi:ribosomal protein S18 acetylase RimI-like enzyme [Bacillus tianshenii]|uniref:Ribosomal protein S18 acetylase RimI-like enzyme n=1 Tax=Sutcliffiella tianshenii TaxID=1463404 RepID=A0ABS2P2R8_9BACI|nr:GNAT family N-acetyltransferase [Bacillus tianshenii]MBM7621247.1 ribosomal protein S18 acetylase RimI-like enzyme [Bacillus tianshenii]